MLTEVSEQDGQALSLWPGVQRPSGVREVGGRQTKGRELGGWLLGGSRGARQAVGKMSN